MSDRRQPDHDQATKIDGVEGQTAIKHELDSPVTVDYETGQVVRADPIHGSVSADELLAPQLSEAVDKSSPKLAPLPEQDAMLEHDSGQGGAGKVNVQDLSMTGKVNVQDISQDVPSAADGGIVLNIDGVEGQTAIKHEVDSPVTVDYETGQVVRADPIHGSVSADELLAPQLSEAVDKSSPKLAPLPEQDAMLEHDSGQGGAGKVNVQDLSMTGGLASEEEEPEVQSMTGGLASEEEEPGVQSMTGGLASEEEEPGVQSMTGGLGAQSSFDLGSAEAVIQELAAPDARGISSAEDLPGFAGFDSLASSDEGPDEEEQQNLTGAETGLANLPLGNVPLAGEGQLADLADQTATLGGPDETQVQLAGSDSGLPGEMQDQLAELGGE